MKASQRQSLLLFLMTFSWVIEGCARDSGAAASAAATTTRRRVEGRDLGDGNAPHRGAFLEVVPREAVGPLRLELRVEQPGIVVVHEFDGAALVEGGEGREDVRMTKAWFQNP